MSKFSEIKKGLSRIEQLENQLNLKQLQINRLLTITQAINDNVSADGLYKMYNSFLSWEMGVKKMALYIPENEQWACASSIGVDDGLIKMEITDRLKKYSRLQKVENDDDHPLFKEFDLVIPVLHKEVPITYAFIGGFEEDDDMYNKVQFITTITNIIAVAIENKRLFRRQLEQERLKREMELASQMQNMLVPSQLPKNECYELASIYKPHLGVGGDYFDFVELADDKFIFCIADIAGKGMAAALLMANFQANFHSLLNKRKEMDLFIKELNQSLFDITGGERFLTFFLAEYNKKTHELKYVNSGHNPPALIMEGQLLNLDKGSTILGSFPELPAIEVGRVQLKGDTMVLTYTDGLTDVQDEKGNFFNEAIIQQFMMENEKLSTTDFNEKLTKYIDEFKGTAIYPDDLTVLTCKIYEQQQNC